nr:uncharacterized protein LOC109768474 [Aegilops tauschii subsp. strangulata]
MVGLSSCLMPLTGSHYERSSRTTSSTQIRFPRFLLPNSGADLAVPTDSNTGSGCAQQLGGHGNDMAGVRIRRRADASPTRLAQSTNRVNPEAPGRTKKVMVGQ